MRREREFLRMVGLKLLRRRSRLGASSKRINYRCVLVRTDAASLGCYYLNYRLYQIFSVVFSYRRFIVRYFFKLMTANSSRT
jgi:hypothetical protein